MNSGGKLHGSHEHLGRVKGAIKAEEVYFCEEKAVQGRAEKWHGHANC